MLPNILQYPVCLAGLLRAGFTAVNVNPLYTARELKHQLNDSGATAIVIVENFCGTLQKVIGDSAIKTVITTQIGDFLGAPKAQIMNFVIRNIKKMIPPWKSDATKLAPPTNAPSTSGLIINASALPGLTLPPY